MAFPKSQPKDFCTSVDWRQFNSKPVGLWWIDANSVTGRRAFKTALAEYSGDGLLRLVLANHFLLRVFWHHYRTAAAQRFIDSAKRALAPLGLAPQEKRIEEVKRGPEIAD